jgi:hypothetical protein
MRARALRSLAAITAASFLYLTGSTEPVFARGVELSNDVSIGSSQGPSEEQCATGSRPCQRAVFGAPRLVKDPAEVGDGLTIVVNLLGQGPASLQLRSLDLVLRTNSPACLELVPMSGCLSRLHYSEIPDQGVLTLDRSRFPLTLHLSNFSGNLPFDDQIFTVEARGMIFPSMGGVPVTITLSGAGHEVLFNRVGDFAFSDSQPGAASDIPTRSTELVRALGRLELALLPKQIVELDDPGSPKRELAVGFTHAFDFPLNRTTHKATLTFRFKSTVDFSNDFILLDKAVGNIGRIAKSARPIPLIFFKDLDVSDPDQAGARDVSINLKRVPVTLLTPDGLASPKLDNLTRDLTDGRLDVIVVGHSVVDYSDLTISLRDSPTGP